MHYDMRHAGPLMESVYDSMCFHNVQTWRKSDQEEYL